MIPMDDDDKVTREDIDRQFHLLRTNPAKFLELTNKLVARQPADPNAYFSRHWAWENLGSPDLALDDLDKSLALEDHYVTHSAKGRLLHGMARYKEAIASFDRCQEMEPEDWPEAFGPLFRADCYARLGDEAAALADCDTLPDDHWTPGLFGAPAGNKREVAAELRRRAAAARGESSK
jgi:tetratricopeptide (TPR) repeat protein